MKKYIKIFKLSFLSLGAIVCSCSEIEKQLDVAENRDLEVEIEEIANRKSQPTAAELEQKKLRKKQKLEEQRKLEADQERIRLENAQKEMDAARLKEEQLQQKLKEEKEVEQELATQIAEIKKKRALQKAAWGQYIGTEYEEIEVTGGKILKNAKATEVRATHVTFMHSTGIANVQFKDLTSTIRRKCKYDPELAELAKYTPKELAKILKARIKAK